MGLGDGFSRVPDFLHYFQLASYALSLNTAERVTVPYNRNSKFEDMARSDWFRDVLSDGDNII